MFDKPPKHSNSLTIFEVLMKSSSLKNAMKSRLDNKKLNVTCVFMQSETNISLD